jgi:hypothetical protein
MDFYNDIGMNHLNYIANDLLFSGCKEDLQTVLSEHYEVIWFAKLNREAAASGPGRNKLCTYRNFKHSIQPEPYVKMILSKRQRSAVAKFCSGVAPLKIETGRYTNTPEEERLCTVCNMSEVESEEHSLIRCQAYQDIRENLFQNAVILNPTFVNFNDCEKLCFILSNEGIAQKTAKACQDILMRRSAILYFT